MFTNSVKEKVFKLLSEFVKLYENWSLIIHNFPLRNLFNNGVNTIYLFFSSSSIKVWIFFNGVLKKRVIMFSLLTLFLYKLRMGEKVFS